MRIRKNGDASLSMPEHSCLVDALRRRCRYGARGDWTIRAQWAGMGCNGEYKAAVKAGLMELAVIPKPSYTVPNPDGMSWWKLTEQGARIVAYWIGQGFASKTLENGDLPSKVIPRLIR